MHFPSDHRCCNARSANRSQRFFNTASTKDTYIRASLKCVQFRGSGDFLKDMCNCLLLGKSLRAKPVCRQHNQSVQVEMSGDAITIYINVYQYPIILGTVFLHVYAPAYPSHKRLCDFGPNVAGNKGTKSLQTAFSFTAALHSLCLWIFVLQTINCIVYPLCDLVSTPCSTFPSSSSPSYFGQ